MKTVLIDNNIICEVLCPNPKPQYMSLARAVKFGEKYSIVVIVGGGLYREYMKHNRFRRQIILLNQSGRIKFVSNASVDREEQRVRANLQLRSDDPHVIALARVTGARVLCSHDTELHSDFTNTAVVPKPQGKVWQCPTHNHLFARDGHR